MTLRCGNCRTRDCDAPKGDVIPILCRYCTRDPSWPYVCNELAEVDLLDCAEAKADV